MRLWLGILAALGMIVLTGIAGNVPADVYPDLYFVKFRNWQESQELQQLKVSLEHHFARYGIAVRMEPLVRQPLLQQFQRRMEQQRGMRKVAVSVLRRLKGIYRLRVSQPYTAAYIQKLGNGLPFVEYIEPVPRRYIVEASNDPLLADQEYLEQIHAVEAWDYLQDVASDTVLVAVLDTGADLDHEDLKDHIFLNPGEMGVDANGQDKRNNGIDDDGNGFVDDWRGWDFYAQDNLPVPGNSHGTHVAGIIGAVVNNNIGIAGVNPNVKLLILKLGPDNPFAVTVANGYEAMVYAAAMGARLINCSWGGPTRSRTEQEVIDAVTQSGTLVIAAAGNEGIQQTFYPAGYRNVIAVGSVNANNRRSYFSNYGYFIDVMAPGENVLSTMPGNSYRRQSGTSMAAPVATGVASLIALKHPEYTPIQVGEHLKITADTIDHLQPNFAGMLGYGRVNALTAVETQQAVAMMLQDYQFQDASGDQVVEKGEGVTLTFRALNVLGPVQQARVVITSDEKYPADPARIELSIGALGTLQQWEVPSPLHFTMALNVPTNFVYRFTILFYEGTTVIGKEYVLLTVNPTYRTLADNDITITLNDRGNLGYNDYPTNIQGEGFRYRDSRSVLFEGALMIGISPDRLSNVARGADQLRQDASFTPSQPVQVVYDTDASTVWAQAQFQDQQRVDEVGVSVVHRVTEPLLPELANVVLLEYTVTNETEEILDSLFTGLYFDWDIGLSGQGDRCVWDEDDLFGYVYNTETDSLPHIGIVLLSTQPVNFFAIDNDGPGGSNPGVYDGFTRAEKWQTMASGIGRKRSNVTDVSAVISGGPVQLAPGESETFVFAIVAGNSKQEVRSGVQRVREYLKDQGMDVQLPKPKVAQKLVIRLYPNPVQLASGTAKLHLTALDSQQVEVELRTALGQLVSKVAELTLAPQQEVEIPLVQDPASLSSAQYFVRIRTPEQLYVLPVVFLR